MFVICSSGLAGAFARAAQWTKSGTNSTTPPKIRWNFAVGAGRPSGRPGCQASGDAVSYPVKARGDGHGRGFGRSVGIICGECLCCRAKFSGLPAASTASSPAFTQSSKPGRVVHDGAFYPGQVVYMPAGFYGISFQKRIIRPEPMA